MDKDLPRDNIPERAIRLDPISTSQQRSISISEDATILTKSSCFEAATASGPNGADGQLHDLDKASLQDFITNKASASSRIFEERKHYVDHVYVPLSEGEIRVLELHPEEDPSALLKGTLHIVNVDFSYPPRPNSYSVFQRSTNHSVSISHARPVWYTALSYVWGPSLFSSSVELPTGTIPISTNLDCALRSLRIQDESVFLWADQICINQADRGDKEQQIPLMGLIYSHATNTLIWLGDDEEYDSILAFDTMHSVHSRLQYMDQKIHPSDFGRWDLPPATDPAWGAVERLLRKPWFTRLWTIQEAILSTRPFVRCGRATEYWDDFASWCSTLEQCCPLDWLLLAGDGKTDKQLSGAGIAGATPNPRFGSITVHVLQTERMYKMTHQRKAAMLDVLVQVRYAQASEPKDKIYGVLALANSDLQPKYSSDVSVRDVYHAASLSQLQLPLRTYRLLCCVDHEEPPESLSWVPDWSVARVTESLGYLTSSTAIYKAGGTMYQANANPEVQHHLSFSNDKKDMILKGILFDRIAEIGYIATDPVFDINKPSRNAQWAAYIPLAKRNTQYPDQESSPFDAFWQTLVAGKVGSVTSKASQAYSEIFSLLLSAITVFTVNNPFLPGQTHSVRQRKGYFTLDSLRSRKPQAILEEMQLALRAALQNRRFAITEKGYFALVPRGTSEGDHICVFNLGHVPYVVRPAKNVACFKLVGESYVHGIMQGEVMRTKTFEMQTVILV